MARPKGSKNATGSGAGAQSQFLPRPATVKAAKALNYNTALIEIALDDGKPLGHCPGQFVELSLMGIGEAPISISSSPTRKDGRFELAIRDVGSVTHAAQGLRAGDKVGIRGPFGRGFDVNFLKGKDIIFMCGGLGLAPLRSLINYVCDNRKDYGRAIVLYGCKKPSELIFCDEVQCYWKTLDSLEKLMTVDKVPDGEAWQENVGLITTLIPKIQFDPAKTWAVICGPPIMYKFAIKEFKARGLADDHIIVSLERRMKCGVGRCGHCQINGLYACQEGPVFFYNEIKDVPEAL